MKHCSVSALNEVLVKFSSFELYEVGAQAGGEIPPSPAWARVTWQAFEVLYFYMYMCSLAVQILTKVSTML